MHLENQVGALPDQLNVWLLTNISIISQFIFEEVSFGLMIGVLFSFKSGLLLASATHSSYTDHSVDTSGLKSAKWNLLEYMR